MHVLWLWLWLCLLLCACISTFTPPPRQVGVVTSTLNGERSRLSASKTRACETIGASAWQAWFGE